MVTPTQVHLKPLPVKPSCVADTGACIVWNSDAVTSNSIQLPGVWFAVSRMREYASAHGLDVHAVAGSQSVLLAFSAPHAAVLGDACLGFAISRKCARRFVWLNPVYKSFRGASHTRASDGGSAEVPPAEDRPAVGATPSDDADDVIVEEELEEDGLVDSVARLALDDTSVPPTTAPFPAAPTGASAALEALVRAHPIQGFRWSDYTISPGETYTYTVWQLEGVPGDARLARPVSVRVRADQAVDGGDQVHFNRGVAGSQAYVRHFGNAKPRDKWAAGAETPWAWLSRGLEEALLRFLRRADGPDWAIRGACYEFTYAPVLNALGAARDRGVDVRVVYDSKPAKWHPERREWSDNGPAALNDAAVRATGVEDIVIRRAAAASSLQHNKFFLLLRDGVPVAVWTGSTNVTTSGLFGHLNVGHVCVRPPILALYAAYWSELATDPSVKALQGFNVALSPVPSLEGTDSTALFSPRDTDAALHFYAALLRRARQAVFLTAAFGLSAVIAEGLLHLPPGTLERSKGPLHGLPQHRVPTYLLLENEGRGQSPHFVQEVRRLPHGHVACGSFLPVEGLFPSHEAEGLTELNKHVEFVHTKFLLVDPLSDAPVVVSGSANFSMASTTRNDENMLVLRGQEARRVAECYLVEFMRVFSHHQPRRAAVEHMERQSGVRLQRRHPKPGEARAQLVGDAAAQSALAPSGSWLHSYFVEGSKRMVERCLFMGGDAASGTAHCSAEQPEDIGDGAGGADPPQGVDHTHDVIAGAGTSTDDRTGNGTSISPRQSAKPQQSADRVGRVSDEASSAEPRQRMGRVDGDVMKASSAGPQQLSGMGDVNQGVGEESSRPQVGYRDREDLDACAKGPSVAAEAQGASHSMMDSPPNTDQACAFERTASGDGSSNAGVRRPYKCSSCGQPKKGHVCPASPNRKSVGK